MKVTRKGLLILVIALLCLGAWSSSATARPIIINDTLSGELLVPGLPHENDDGSTTCLGVIYLGAAAGNLPGNWATILAVTYPAGSTTGNDTGVIVVGDRTDNVYGILIGTMDATMGTFDQTVVVLGGFGAYAGMAGAGTCQGTLTNEGETIEGSLSLVLTPTPKEGLKTLPEGVKADINRALSLLKP